MSDFLSPDELARIREWLKTRAADDEADDTGDTGEELTEIELWPETDEDREEFMDRCVQELIPCIGEDNAVDVCTSKWVAARRLGKKGFVTAASLEGQTFKLKIEPCGKTCIACEGANAPFKAFDPNEPRDESGKWTEGGGEDVSEFDEGHQTAGHGDKRPGVGMYSGLDNSFTMNDALRNNETDKISPELRTAISDLTDEINKSVTKNDHVMFRGVHGDFVAKLTPGATVHDAAFLSGTLDESWAKRMFARPGGAVIRISVPKGSHLLTVARSSEDEVILQKGSTLKIESAKKRGKIWRIDATIEKSQ